MNENDKSVSDLISLSEASTISGFTATHVRRLVASKQIWGVKIGRNWVTTRQAVEDYISHEHPSGRKPNRY